MAEACAAWQRAATAGRCRPSGSPRCPTSSLALQAAIEHFTPPGAPIVLPTPAYMPFLVVPGLLGREIVQVPLVPGGDGRLTYDLDGLDRAVRRRRPAAGARQPAQPDRPGVHRGRAAGAGRGGRAARRAGVRRRDPRAAGVPRVGAPALRRRCRRRPPAHTVTATSASKAWNLPGLKAAQLIVSNEADAAHWAEVGWLSAHGTSTLGVAREHRRLPRGRAVAGRASWPTWTATGGCSPTCSPSTCPRSATRRREGTYLAWLDCRALGVEGSPPSTSCAGPGSRWSTARSAGRPVPGTCG